MTIGGVARTRAAQGIIERTGFRQFVEIDDRDAFGEFDPTGDIARRHQHLGAAVGQHICKPFGRKLRIERNIGATRFLNADERGDERWRAWGRETNQAPGTDAEGTERVRDGIRPHIELAIACDVALEGDGRRHRRRHGLRLEKLRKNPLFGIGRRRGVPAPQQRLLGRWQQGKRAQRRRGCRIAASSSVRYCPMTRSIVARLNSSVLYSRLIRRVTSLSIDRVNSNCAPPRSSVIGSQVMPSSTRPCMGALVTIEHYLRQRGAVGVSALPDFLHQPVEGYILVREGVEGGRPDSQKQRAERRVAGKVDTHHQRVDKGTDEALGGRSAFDSRPGHRLECRPGRSCDAGAPRRQPTWS